MDILRNDYIKQLEAKSWNGKVKIQATFSLCHVRDSFRKIVILDGISRSWTDENGVTYIGVIPFLLNTDKMLI